MLNRICKVGLLVFFALATITMFSSCGKEKDTIARIIVKNTNGEVVPQATVLLYPNASISPNGAQPNTSLTKQNITDANGKAEFTYELEAVLKIEATILIGNDYFQGHNVINLLKGKTTTKYVEISKI